MIYVTLDEAREKLSDLLNAVNEGEILSIEIEPNRTVELAKTPSNSVVRRRELGSAKGKIIIHPGFYDPIDDFEDDV